MSDEPSDEDLLEAWILGDAGAFTSFYMRHFNRVKGYGAKKGLGKQDAEEVAQLSFLKLH